jgi:hypothetical protein
LLTFATVRVILVVVVVVVAGSTTFTYPCGSALSMLAFPPLAADGMAALPVLLPVRALTYSCRITSLT